MHEYLGSMPSARKKRGGGVELSVLARLSRQKEIGNLFMNKD